TVTATDSQNAAVTDTVTGSEEGPVGTPWRSRRGPATFVETDGTQNLVADGTPTVGDLDVTATVTHTRAFDGNAVWRGGTVTAEQIATLTDGKFSATGAAGVGTWDCAANGVSLDRLAAGETITFSYTVMATDSQNAAVTDTVT